MRLSLWQQFSSNHSAYFTVVGTFESTEKANAAAAELRRILGTIDEWHYQHPGRLNQDGLEPTSPEVEFAQQYGVEWTDAPVWFYDSSVPVLDKSVILSSGETWSAPTPFIGILKKLGGAVVYSIEADEPLAQFSVKITCTPSDEAIASQLAERILTYLDLPEPWDYRPPWYVDDPNKDEHNNNQAAEDAEAWGSLNRVGQVLTFDLRFFDLTKGLPALISYLKAQGCTDIEYHFIQTLEAD
jgi:hypothetical protein